MSICVATKKLIESETTSKQQFLGWIFDFCGVSHEVNGVSEIKNEVSPFVWGVPSVFLNFSIWSCNSYTLSDPLNPRQQKGERFGKKQKIV